MRKPLLLVLSLLIGGITFAQENTFGVNFIYNGHALDARVPQTFKSVESSSAYSAKSILTTDFADEYAKSNGGFVTPYIQTGVFITKAFTSTKYLKGNYLLKFGVVSIAQAYDINLFKYENNQTKVTELLLSFEERVNHVAFGLDRVMHVFKESNKLNLMAKAGFNIGLGLGANLKVDGYLKEYDSTTEENKRTALTQNTEGNNSIYGSLNVAAGPSLKITNRLQVNFLLEAQFGSVKKIGVGNVEFINTGFSSGLSFQF